MAPHSSTLAWKIPWMEEPGRLQSMGSLESDTTEQLHFHFFIFMHWRRKWRPTPVFLPGQSQGRESLVGCHLWGHTESDTTEATQQQQQQQGPLDIAFQDVWLQVSDHTIVIILVMKISFVQFSCVSLPPLLNIFCFCQVHTIPVLYRAHLCMKYSLGIPIFLKRSLVFPILLFSSISLH